MQMVWPFDDRGRLVGEDVWEPQPTRAELFKLDPAAVLTTEQARKLLFDEFVFSKKASATA
jgi:hypothetical protein